MENQVYYYTLRLTLGILVSVGSALHGQTVEGEGKLWLDARADPAEITVNGIWMGGTWGSVTLNQAPGDRAVTGKGDAWDVRGVVSGKKLFLLFSNKGKVAYSAELSTEGATSLDGRYVEGLLSDHQAGRPIHLSLISASAKGCKGEAAKADQASVVVYRVSSMVGALIKPSVYCDGQELALMYSGRFFSVPLSPGKHTIALGADAKSVSVDAKSGGTYYVRVAPGFSIQEVAETSALPELKHLKPADAKHVILPDMVSITTPPREK
jgi:hypothetical protein